MNDRSNDESSNLAAPLGGARSRTGTQADAVDGIVPRMVATPRDEGEIAAVIAAARTQHLSLVVRGGGTLLGCGNRPRALDVIIDTLAMDSVIERNPEDMTVTVGAGATLEMLGTVLERDGQRFAVDAGNPRRSTLGGIVAANAAGGLAHGFGAPRDLVLGMTVVDGGGRKLKLGGRVVKNVAGYDLVRVFCGSFGTLGVITELTLRTHPLPDVARTFESRFTRSADVEAARAALFHSELPLAAFDVEAETSAAPPEWRLVLRLEGTEAEVEYQVGRCGALCAGAAAHQSSEWASPFGHRQHENVVMRCGALPDRTVALVERLCAELPAPNRAAARLGDGAVRAFARMDADADAFSFVDAVRRVASAHGSNAVIERLPARLESSVDAWGDPPQGFALMRELKKRFDPDGVLAPGRFVGGI